MERRKVIKGLMMAGGLGLMNVGPYKRVAAMAQTNGSDYKALVAIFLYGGNDSNNMIVPIDSRYSMYAAARGSLSVPQGALLSLGNTSYGVHPNMPGTQLCFNQGNLAVVANMGPLVQPTTMSEYLAGSAPLPLNLESHPDQRNCMATALQTSGFGSGWGGRISDALASDSQSAVPMAMSLFGATAFINGIQTKGYFPGGGWSCIEGSWCSTMEEGAQELLSLPSGAALIQADQGILSNVAEVNTIYTKAMTQATAPKVAFPQSDLGAQLQEVAKIMSVRSQLGASRQIFLVGMLGFDTHANQLSIHGPLLQQLDQALLSFSQALQAMNLYEQVTTFTLSEFTRTLLSNGNGGSDHAWGGHHLVMGGAVKGGKIYGSFPTLECGGPDDISKNGSWLPSTSINQYAATLALWFGVQPSQLTQVLPNIQNFPSPALGFV